MLRFFTTRLRFSTQTATQRATLGQFDPKLAMPTDQVAVGGDCAVDATGHVVQVSLQYGPAEIMSRFHGAWLRSNCFCSVCREQSSSQKLVMGWQSSARSKPTMVSVRWNDSGDKLAVTFADGHVSEFTRTWLQQYSYDDEARALRARAAQRRRTTWYARDMHEHGLPAVQYSSVMETDAGLYEWISALERFGVAVIRNAPTDETHVDRLAERIGPVQRTIYGETWNVVVEENPINVAYTSVELPSHADLLYYEAPPGVQLLHFRETAASGGANMLVDGAAAYAKMLTLYPQHVELLSRYNLAYQYRSGTHWMYRNRPPLEIDQETGELIAMNVSPPFEGPASCVPFDVMPAMIEAVDVLQRMVTSDPELLYRVRFDTGDVVTFNNRRVLHAREAIDEQSGRRHLEGTYVESDLFWSKVRTMRSQIEKEKEPVVTAAFGTGHI